MPGRCRPEIGFFNIAGLIYFSGKNESVRAIKGRQFESIATNVASEKAMVAIGIKECAKEA